MARKDMPTVLVADDHSVFRAGLRDLLEDERMKVVAEASSGEEAVQQALRRHPDVVIMDVRMPHMDGFAASREIKRQLPETAIVMMSGIDDDEGQLIRAIDAGASSYVVKSEEPQSIVEAVRTTQHGGAYLPPRATQVLMEHVSSRSWREQMEPHERTGERLTPRERDVLRLAATGRHNEDIARELDISRRSVGNHLAKVHTKLGIHTRAEAVLYALKAGIATAD